MAEANELVLGNVKGPKGDKGDTGPQGIQGPKGDTGAVGPQGPEGPIGPKGETGKQGIQGIQGPKGEKGDTGEQGPIGATGATGKQGPQGPEGPIGATGPKGEKGDTGAQGPKGLKGDTGERGPQGATGPQGPQGKQGPAGSNGVGVPLGGTSNQVLVKSSATDYETEWKNVSDIVINNASTSETNKTWSSSKLFTELNGKADKSILNKYGFVSSKLLGFTTDGESTLYATFTGDLTSDEYSVSLNYPTNLSLEQIQAIGESVPWITEAKLSGSNTVVTVTLKSGKAPSVNFNVDVVVKYEGVSK